LPEGNEKLLLATAVSDDIPASRAAMEVHKDFDHTKVLSFKTPAKRMRSSDEGESPALLLLDVINNSPFFKPGKEAPITELEHVAGVLMRLDKGITINKAPILNFREDHCQEHGKVGDVFRALWLRLKALSALVGTILTCLTLDYLLAPSSWASIGAIAAKLDKL
jgi:hypothetical protein